MPPRKRSQASQSLISSSFKPTKASGRSAPHSKTKTADLDVQLSSAELERAHDVLKAFDLDMDYGPIIGIMRTDRLERALSLGFSVNQQIQELLRNRRLLKLHPELNLNIWHNMDSLI